MDGAKSHSNDLRLDFESGSIHVSSNLIKRRTGRGKRTKEKEEKGSRRVPFVG